MLIYIIYDRNVISSPKPKAHGELIGWYSSRCPSAFTFSKIFFSETAWPMKAKFYMKHLYKGETNVCINNSGHMTKMATMPIYDKNPSKIFFSGTGGPISTKLRVKYRWLKYYNVYINHDPVMT